MRPFLMATMLAISTAAAARPMTLRHPSGFGFVLPDVGWDRDIEQRGDVWVLTTGGDVPELTVFFAPLPAGDFDARAVDRPGIEILGERLAGARLAGAVDKRQLGDVTATVENGTYNGGMMRVARLERGGARLLVVGVPRAGIFERGAANFDALLRGVQPRAKAGPRPSGPRPTSKVTPLPPLIAVKEVRASSTLTNARRPDRYAAWRALLPSEEPSADEGDGRYTSMWCEGEHDEGVGTTLTIDFAAPSLVTSVRIAAGVWKSPKLYAANNRPRALEVTADAAVPVAVAVPEARGWVEARLPPGAIRRLTVRIAAVDKGRIDDSCLTAIELMRGRDRLAPVVGVEAAALLALPAWLAGLRRALDGDDKVILGELLKFPFRWHDADSFFDDGSGAVTFADAHAIATACRDKRPYACPHDVALAPRPGEQVRVAGERPAELTLRWPCHREVCDAWTIVWEERWKLQSIDFD